MRNVKLKYYKNYRADDMKLIRETLFIIISMAFVPVFICVTIYFADKVDRIDNFLQAFFVSVILFFLFMLKLWKLK